jgi:UDP-glucose 4-epimerase
MKSLKICVTGGAGFIGTNMLINLRQRYESAEIISIDIRQPAYPVNGVSYKLCDIRNQKKLDKALVGCGKVFHLAALIGTHESFDDPALVFDTNVRGTLNVLEFAKKSGAEVFVAGMPGIWFNPYSISKDAAVRLAVSYAKTFDVHACALRWYSVYGPYQYVARYNKAVPTFIYQALHNKPLTIYGEGTQVADFLYVDDAVNLAIDMLEQKQWGKAIPCSSGDGTAVNDLAKMIIKECKSRSNLKHLPMRQGEPVNAHIVADRSELDATFPATEQQTLNVGLQKTINHYAQHPPLD